MHGHKKEYREVCSGFWRKTGTQCIFPVCMHFWLNLREPTHACPLQITTVMALVPGLSFVDTHAHGEQDSGFGFKNKPDITVYSDGKKEMQGCCEAKSMEMHIEFEWQGDDPFIVPHNKMPCRKQRFVKKSAAAIEILGQITTYVGAQMSAQFCTHVFSILLMCQQAWILQWDRKGVVVMEPIHYCDNTALLNFLSCYLQASPSECGVDTMILHTTKQEAKRAREKLLLPPKMQAFKAKVPKAGATPKQMISPIFPTSWFLSELPASHVTHGCPAYYVEEGLAVYLKDSWWIIADGIVSEGNTYTELNKKKVLHVSVCLASREVEAHELQQPQTQKCSREAWACSSRLCILIHSHYQLTLDIVGKALCEFSSTHELVQAICDMLCGKLLLNVAVRITTIMTCSQLMKQHGLSTFCIGMSVLATSSFPVEEDF